VTRGLLASLALALIACAEAPTPGPIDGLIGQPGVVTLVNLHPGAGENSLSVSNFQQIGLIPVCSRVTLLELRSRRLEPGFQPRSFPSLQPRSSPSRTPTRLRFRDETTGRIYEYADRADTGESFQAHLTRYFGEECPRALQSLGEIDRRGVAAGEAFAGMSKQGVIFALGYPPLKETPSLDSKRWIYFRSRYDREAVQFDETGHVTLVDED